MGKGHIVTVEGVCGGRPVIRGTRIEPRHIVPAIWAGESVEEAMGAYGLTREQVGAAIAFLAEHPEHAAGPEGGPTRPAAGASIRRVARKARG